MTGTEEHVGCYRSCLGALGQGSVAVPGMESTTGKDKPTGKADDIPNLACSRMANLNTVIGVIGYLLLSLKL